MSAPPLWIARRYGLALARAFADSAGPAASDADVAALASFFERQFTREALRLPSAGRDEFLSAVALEMLDRMRQTAPSREPSPADLEKSFKRATLTVLDTIRHRVGRARTRARAGSGSG